MQVKRKLDILICVMVIILILLLNKFYFDFSTRCFTEKCFENAAKKCGNAWFVTSDKLGNTVEYEVNNCIINKRFLEMNPEEPKEIWEALQNKTMTCVYEAELFDLKKYEGMYPDAELEECTGSLLRMLDLIVIKSLSNT